MLIRIWLAAITAWWLLAAGALGLGVAWGWATRPAPARLDGYRDVAMVVLFEPLASRGTGLVELHHLPADLATGRDPSHWPRLCRCGWAEPD